EAFTDCATGIMVNLGFMDGMSVEEAKVAIVNWLSDKGVGTKKVNYKLRDWVFSRQRYWGEPIPIVHCDDCGYVPVDEADLPVKLPNVESYEPTDNGDSPLANIPEWFNTTCPKCGKPAKRELDTMPQWAGSSWYFLRYCDPHNDKELASKEALEYWTPVSWYNGGMEHTTLHLLYSRFWHKFLYDIGVVPTAEPYAKRTSHGMILGENGEKMSKSRGNVVNPDDIINEYGADTMRLYEMFIGDFEKAAPWSSNSIKGCKRFLERIWGLQENVIDNDDYRDALVGEMHRTIKKVSADIEEMKFNTAIAALMSLLNSISEIDGKVTRGELKTILLLLSPFAPHLCEEMWETLNYGGTINDQNWPQYDEAKCVDNEIEIVVQVNGKIRARMKIANDEAQDSVISKAKADEKVAAEISGKTIVKELYVKGKLVNIVVR
ncbi:MAG: class I tRNA ligase family protein, partial [Clostridia bacterium]|nr:class I tRNA ligase family protein [Clostridia bacterium]